MELELNSPLFVAGHRGLVGSAIVRALRARGHERLLLRNRSDLNLEEQGPVEQFFAAERPAVVVLAAAKVGGIYANDRYPADFIAANLRIQSNVIDAAHRHGTRRLLFLGSSCIYPRECPQPIREEYLLSGPLEPTNEPYAVAKIAGIKLCEAYRRQFGCDFRSVMPTNLYGPGDNYHPVNSHVIPALLRRFHEATRSKAPEVVVWGSGRPRREFLYVDDMAEACVHLLGLDRSEYETVAPPHLSHINVGSGRDISIAELAGLIAETVGYRGEIRFDAAKPDGTPRKLLDVSRLGSLGWAARVEPGEGLKRTYAAFLEEHPDVAA